MVAVGSYKASLTRHFQGYRSQGSITGNLHAILPDACCLEKPHSPCHRTIQQKQCQQEAKHTALTVLFSCAHLDW